MTSASAVASVVAGIEAESYVSHPLHGPGREWEETNCATDMWIEILHGLGADPVPGLAFSVAVDFGGDQWTMFTYPREDLRDLYGIVVNELNVWRPLVDHVEEQLAMGHLVSFDVDAFWLPDTRGITYRTGHQKTTLCAVRIDRSARRLGYFHNAGYYELEGEDFDALLGHGDEAVTAAMPPYTEQIRLDRYDPSRGRPDRVVDRLRAHLAARPEGNPVSAMADRVSLDAERLAQQGIEYFHRYAFGTCRHLGANAQLAAAFVDWLDRADGGLAAVADDYRSVAAGAKTLEFQLARAAAGRRVDVASAIAPLAQAWGRSLDTLSRGTGIPAPVDDHLAGAVWQLCATGPGEAADPGDLDRLTPAWIPAEVPGTAAGAIRLLGWMDPDGVDYDGRDWWYRTDVEAPAGEYRLVLEGLATVADVWCGGELVVHSENMFRRYSVPVRLAGGPVPVVVRFAALAPALDERRPRPRWRSPIVSHRNLRWYRTSLIGRAPGWSLTPPIVGPWRAVRLLPGPGRSVLAHRVRARCEGGGGRVTVALTLSGPPPQAVEVRVGADRIDGAVEQAIVHSLEDGRHAVEAEVALDSVERWWPAGYGAQTLYPVAVAVDGEEVWAGQVGFRTIDIDRAGGAFRVVVNGTPVFCRGAVWWPLDPVTGSSPPEAAAATLESLARAHANTVRLSGMGVYETEAFWATCDRLGLMVLQDAMIAFSDPPATEEWLAEVAAELEDNLGGLGGHPALVLVSGSIEVHEQEVMTTGRAATSPSPVLDDLIPAFVSRALPGVPYVASIPGGGPVPFQVQEGISHYYGVGMYLRDPDDGRRSGLRFAAECLFMATPPRPAVVDMCGGPGRAGHAPEWKRGVHRDPGRSWDMEDLRDHYVAQQLRLDPVRLRYEDPERALEAGRVSNAQLVERLFTDWRRPGSLCAGVVLGLMDQRPGAGWGLLDATGEPKSTWYALKRACAPVIATLSDEGLAGLGISVVNDRMEALRARLTLSLYRDGAHLMAAFARDVHVGPHSAWSATDTDLTGEFRDLNQAYRFGRPDCDLVVATVAEQSDPDTVLAQSFFFPLGLGRDRERDVGLRALLDRDDEGWALELTSDTLAMWVVADLEHHRPEDSYFHLAPRSSRRIRLHPAVSGAPPGDLAPPEGSVSAWNSRTVVRLSQP